MNNQNQEPISQEVLAKIKSQGIKMRPRFYFIARTALFALVAIFAILIILYFASFIFFSLRASGAWFLPRFGGSGIKILLISLPWIPILIAVAAIILLEALAKRFNLVYRRPIVYSFLTIIALAIVGGFLLEKTPFHSKIFMRAQNERLAGLGDFYRQFGAPQPRGTRFGVVLSARENKFLMRAPNNEMTTVIYTKGTRIPDGYIIKEGDKVSVLGKLINGILEAFEIRQVRGEFNFFPTGPHEFFPMK
jgi:hypothetical protein